MYCTGTYVQCVVVTADAGPLGPASAEKGARIIQTLPSYHR